jgi:hypothetical protein
VDPRTIVRVIPHDDVLLIDNLECEDESRVDERAA